jgi:DNA replication and repair protein RecF
LDDFFEKLDKQRLTQLINLINNDTFDQVFLSDTELERSKKIFDENKISFTAHHIDNGHINSQKSI